MVWRWVGVALLGVLLGLAAKVYFEEEPKFVLDGFVAPGFELVRRRFSSFFELGLEECAQLTVYVHGEKVVDLWGARLDPETEQPLHGYGPGHLQNVFSSSKSIESLVVSMLAERGHLRYDQRISDLWPEYGRHMKEETTVAQLMRHEAGIPVLDQSLHAADLSAQRLKEGSVSEILANQRLHWWPGERREYHGITRGFLLNEVVRRADPAGRTIGEFLRDEIATPLGLEDELVLGVPDRLLPYVAPVTGPGRWWIVMQTLLPRWLGGSRLAGLLHWPTRLALFKSELYDRSMGFYPFPQVYVSNATPEALERMDVDYWHVYNDPQARRGEVPSVNVHASARAMAAVASLISEGGAFQGTRLLSEEGMAAGNGDPVNRTMLGRWMPFTNAGFCLYEDNRLWFAGWAGRGGSVLQWHPEKHISFGYAVTLLEPVAWNPRAFILQGTVLHLVSSMANSSL